MSEEIYGEIFKDDDLTTEKILQTLLKSDKDLAVKTEIHTPVETSLLKALVPILKTEKLPILSKFIDEFLKNYKEDMISFMRKSREEVTKVLAARMEDKNTTRDISDKLLGRE